MSRFTIVDSINAEIEQNHLEGKVLRVARGVFSTGYTGVRVLLVIAFVGILIIDAAGLLVILGYFLRSVLTH